MRILLDTNVVLRLGDKGLSETQCATRTESAGAYRENRAR